jgi:PAS domain S-box-containing protein
MTGGTAVIGPRSDSTDLSGVELRVLILAPTGNDARLTAQFLVRGEINVRICKSVDELCAELRNGCGGVVLAEEALAWDVRGSVLAELSQQPSWSDVPIAVITGGGEEAQRRLRQFSVAGAGGNVTLLERPFHPETLLRTVEAALRARKRQYQVRDLLRDKEESQRRLGNILESISDAFVALDADFRFTYVNASFRRLVSALVPENTELLGRYVWEDFPEFLGTAVDRFFRRVMEEQRPGSVETFYEPLERWLEIRAHPGRETLSIYLADVTERRRAERALRESEARYRSLMERASEGIFVADLQGRHIIVNPAGCEMLGYELEDILQLRASELYDPAGADIVHAVERLAEGEVLRFDGKMRRRDGRLMDVESSMTRLSNGLIQSVVRDVTARKIAEERQRRRNDRSLLLSETLAHLLGAGEPEAIVRELLPKVAQHLGVEIYLNFMVEEPGMVLRLRAHAGLDAETANAIGSLNFGEAICGKVAETWQSVVANHVHESDDPSTELIRGLGVRCYACNPLTVGDRLLGTLSFGSRRRDSFDAEEAEFLEVVAQYSAVALDRLRTERELADRTRTLEVLNHTGAALAGELETGRLMQVVTEAGHQVTQATVSAFLMDSRGEGGGQMVVSAAAGVTKETAERIAQLWSGPILTALAKGEGIVRVEDTSKDRRVNGVGARPRAARGLPTLRSYLAAPVNSRSGEFLGALFFGHPEPHRFGQQAEQIVAGIAAQAAISLDNARLYERVQNTADRLNLSISAANLGDFTWDAETDRILLSPRTAEIYGVRQEEGLTRSALRLMLAPADQERARDALRYSIESHTDYDIEYRVDRPDGTQCWVAAKGRPFYAADGRILGMVGVVQDITEHKKAEVVAEAKRRVLYLLAEGASLREVLDELVRTVELESGSALRTAILLLDEEQARLRRGAAPNLPEELTQALDGTEVGVGLLGASLHTKQPAFSGDLEKHAQESFATIALAHGFRACWSTPILSGEGSVLGVCVVFCASGRERSHADLQIVETAIRTAAVAIERRHNERALRESEARQRQLLAGLPVACYTMDALGRLTFFNEAAHRLWGRTPRMELDLWSGLFAIPAEQDVREPIAESPGAITLRERRSIRGLEGFIMRPDGSRRWVVPHPDPLFDPAGNCIGVINVIVDVTEERHAKRLLQEAKETAEAASAAKDRFLAVLSHELRTPLTPVLMTVASLETDPALPPDLREDMSMIRRNVELETKLIDDLLDLSRITTGKLRLRLQPLNLNAAVREVCAICDPAVAEKNIRLQCELDPSVGLVSADSARLQQVLWNVLKNAAKFTPAGGQITVSTHVHDNGSFEVKVRDTGIGIDPAMLPRIFDAFEQGAGITRQFGGLGLGLAISKALVELHGGTIRAESSGPAQGSIFTVRIPRQEGIIHPAGFDALPPPTVEGPPLRLLLVEDHADTARTLARLLQNAGFQVEVVHDVAAALQVGRRLPFDVLVSDIGLPDGTGYDVLKGLGSGDVPPAIAMSGFGMDEDLRRSREAGFAEHLVKPVNIQELMQAIRRIADRAAAAR